MRGGTKLKAESGDVIGCNLVLFHGSDLARNHSLDAMGCDRNGRAKPVLSGFRGSNSMWVSLVQTRLGDWTNCALKNVLHSLYCTFK